MTRPSTRTDRRRRRSAKVRNRRWVRGLACAADASSANRTSWPSGVSEVFRRKIVECLSAIAERIAVCLDEARQRGEIEDECDVRQMADLLVDCWEGAALRSRLRRNRASLNAMLDFYFLSVVTVETRRSS